jgi:hypothetical protein
MGGLLYCREERGLFKSEMFGETTLVLDSAALRAVCLQIGDVELVLILCGLLAGVGDAVRVADRDELLHREGQLPDLQLPSHYSVGPLI